MTILRAFGYPNRVVAILAPILSPVVGAFASWLASKWPNVPESSLNEIFLAASVIAMTPAIQFIHHRAKWDLQQEEQKAMGDGRSQVAPATGEDFEALGIAAPAAAAPAPAVAAAPADDADWLYADEDEDDAGLDDDIDTVALDEEEEAEGLPDDAPAVTAGG